MSIPNRAAQATWTATSVADALRAAGPVVLRICRGILHDGPDAEDAAQEALVALSRALAAFRGECSLSTYATRIAMRTAMRQRARRRRIDDNRETEAASTDASGDGTPGAELRLLVMSLLDRLPREQADALALRFVLGHSPAEIAEICGAPVNTIRSRIRLARGALRTAIADHPGLRGDVEVDDDE